MYLLDISMVGQNSKLLVPSTPKGNIKFEILLVKIFTLKQNTISITSSYYRRNQENRKQSMVPRKQSMVPSDKGLQWVNVKQKSFRQI